MFRRSAVINCSDYAYDFKGDRLAVGPGILDTCSPFLRNGTPPINAEQHMLSDGMTC